jgi:hypothetical protein
MGWETVRDMGEGEFRRLTGIKRKTFDECISILEEAEKTLKIRGGKPNKCCVQDRLLMALEYWREYRTYFHISMSYGISESACYRNICFIENTLIKSGRFSLQGKKELLRQDKAIKTVLIDVTETPIERPKKTKKLLLWEEKTAHDKNTSCCE